MEFLASYRWSHEMVKQNLHSNSDELLVLNTECVCCVCVEAKKSGAA